MRIVLNETAAQRVATKWIATKYFRVSKNGLTPSRESITFCDILFLDYFHVWYVTINI